MPLAQRRRVHQSALGPEPVQAALDAERPEVRIEALAVVADLLHDAERPALVQAEKLAQLAVASEEALDRRAARVRLLGDRARAEAELLGLDHGKEGPPHDVEPALVALAHRGAERLLRDELGQ